MKETKVSQGSNTNRRGWLKGAATLGVAAAAGAIPGYSLAQEEPLAPPAPAPSPSQQRVQPRVVLGATSYIYFSGVDFQPYSANAYAIASFCGIYPTTTPGYFAAKLNLPQHSVITDVQVSVVNNVSGGIQTFYVIDTNLNTTGGIGSYFSRADISAVDSNLQTVSTSSNAFPYLIDNSIHSYQLLWIPSGASSSQILYGVRVGYAGGQGRFGANG